MELTYSIYYPGGNTTALVNQLILNPALKKRINDKIMAVNPQVEQVGFLSQRSYRLEMAGGEFCGNATRCATFYYLRGQTGKINLKVSGVSNKLTAGVDRKGNVWAQMPIYKNLNKIKTSNSYTIVPLQGIIQVITELNFSPAVKSLKNRAKNILKKFKLLTTTPAAGVIFTQQQRKIIKIYPIVWVRDIKTFFYETACASGTAAVGMFESITTKKKNITLLIQQPSKFFISVSVKRQQNTFSSVIINSSIKILEKNLTLTI